VSGSSSGDNSTDDDLSDSDLGDDVISGHADHVVEFVVDDDNDGRVDAVVFHALAADHAGLVASRSRVRSLIDEGAVSVDGLVVKKAGAALRGGQRVQVRIAAGMVVHPGAGNDDGTVANALIHRYPKLSVGGERRPGIVHRLDKDTSGLLVVAKNDETLVALQRQFQGRSVNKRYVACCLGAPANVGVTVDWRTGHARSGSDRRRYTTKLEVPHTPTPALREAHTAFVVRGVAGGVAVVDVTLHTGRTHQIRAHMADHGHPLLQDTLYGGAHIETRLRDGPVRTAVVALKRQALHAASLSLTHPRDGRPLVFEAAPPADMAAIIAAVMKSAVP
jgi:23S rRNA pseudouridine1911/1915/1917 synthase